MDTVTIVCDSIAVKLSGITGLCQTPTKESCSGWIELGIVLIVCLAVVLIASYGISKFYKDKEAERLFQEKLKESITKIQPDTVNKPEKSTEEKNQEAEIKRQNRVADLLKDICELSQDPGISKEVKGKYNDSDANKLLRLYVTLDKYNKTGEFILKENVDDNQTQQS